MFTRVILVVSVGLSILCSSTYAGCFDGCSIDKASGQKVVNKYKLSEFENNLPKKKELIRTKAYFKYDKPLFSIAINFSDHITFGFLKNSTTFAIFKDHNDYTYDRNPCDVIENVKEFSRGYFVEVVFILERTGHFSVLIDGEDTFTLTCDTGINFDEGETYVYIDQSENKDFLYDCSLN